MADAELLRQAEGLFDQLFRDLKRAVVIGDFLLPFQEGILPSCGKVQDGGLDALEKVLDRVSSCLEQIDAVCPELLSGILHPEVVSIAEIEGPTYIECALEWVARLNCDLNLIPDKVITWRSDETAFADWEIRPEVVVNSCAARVAWELRRELQRVGDRSFSQEGLPPDQTTAQLASDIPASPDRDAFRADNRKIVEGVKYPQNQDIRDLCAKLAENHQKIEGRLSNRKIAIAFYDGDENKADAGLRQARNFPHLWKGVAAKQ